MTTLTLSDLHDALAGSAAAFRSVATLQPAGGAGDKVFPPTYSGGQYATERRRLPGRDEPVDCVLLDSVQSQANRMELALLDAWESSGIPLPVVSVDFRDQGLPKALRVTSLEAPHRIVDALLRDSLLDGQPFRKAARGQALDYMDNKNATALFELCPTALLFGLWDSTGPRGGLGAKFARAMVSEIVGIDAMPGVKTSSRIDPAQIMLGAGPVYSTADKGWTLSESEARTEKGKPAKVGKEGKPSEVNHGNVTPSIDSKAGGFTIAFAQRTTTLSLPALRRLRFPIDGDFSSERDLAARVTLAALGLCAATLARDLGGDLRSRCHLIAETADSWELLDRPGEAPRSFSLDAAQAIELYRQAVDAARAVGLPWLTEELKLSPSPQLVTLVRKSQELAASMAEASGEE
jgi:CRISPR-associated protein Csb1